jgi:hypothetical protein
MDNVEYLERTENPNITFYGERGIVNGLILDTKDDMEKQISFLKAIRFAGNASLPWADDVTGIQWLVEPSFSEFGNPDLVLIAQTTSGKYVVFIEAKLRGYDDSAENINEKTLLPENYNHNASKINIQLAFKYRFARAFTLNKNIKRIEETQEEAAIYNDKPRRIHNEIIVDMCKEFFDGVKEFYFVALTNDNKKTKPYESGDYLPAVGKSNWDRDKGYFGLVSYDTLESVNWRDSAGKTNRGIIRRNHGYYGSAALLMLGLPADSAERQICGEFATLKTKNIENWSEEQRVLASDASVKLDAVPLHGSYSRVISGVTVLKILADPKDNHRILIGLRDDNIPPDYDVQFDETVYYIGVGSRKKLFHCYSIASRNELEFFYPFAKRFISRHELV